MRTAVLVWAIIFPLLLRAQVWQENFNGLTNGATSDAGATAWTTTLPTGGASSFSKQTPVTGYELFLINNTGGEGMWQSAVVDISGYTEIAIELTLYSNFTYSSDYIKCFYKINGGAEVQFGELLGNNALTITSAASAIVSGNSLQIIVRGSDNTTGTTGGIINAMAFDDVTLTNISVLYSRTSGNWNNNTTWSLTSFTGASCSCIPSINSRVVIGNNNNISIPTTATAAGVTIQNTGRLQFTGNTTLTIARGGAITVDNGGLLNNNGGNGTVAYGAYTYNTIINGTVSISTLNANTGASVNFSGNGSITTTDFIINSGVGKTIQLNVAGGITVNNDLNFQPSSSNTSLLNLKLLTIGNRIVFTSNNVSITNSATLTTQNLVVNASTNNGNSITNSAATGTVNIGTINFNNGDFLLDNFGTINQTGNFSNVDAGSSLRNENGSTWNFSGTTSTTRLYCNYGTNTFNYNALGSQSISIPVDNYSNLTLSGSGTKTLPGNLDVNENLSIGGAAQLDISTSLHSIKLAGDWSVTSTNADPFIERMGTVTFDGNSDQLISTTKGTESFYSLAVNKASGNVIQSSNVNVSNAISLNNGGLSINGNVLSITNSNTSAITRTNGCIISETNSAPYSQLRWSIGTSTGSYIFPFGKTTASSDYTPFTFNVTSAGSPATGTVSVLTYATPTNNLPWPSDVTNLNGTLGTDNSAKVIDRFWYITLNGYTTNPYSTVTFVATPSEVGTNTNLRAQRWNSLTSRWDPPKPGQSNPNIYSVTVPNVNTFSPWTLSSGDAPLPVNLSFFNATLKNNVVNVEWKTMSEHNNNFFSILKLTNEETFQELYKVNGAGTSNDSHSYAVTDSNPYVGRSYYQLKQTDFDGAEVYFKPVMVEYQPETARLSAYPLPFDGGALTIELSGYQANENLFLEITTMLGEKVYEKEFLTDALGTLVKTLTFNSPLSPGSYYLKAGNYLKLLVK